MSGFSSVASTTSSGAASSFASSGAVSSTLHLAQGFVHRLAAGNDAYLAEVVAGLESTHVIFLPHRHQAPADQADEEHANDGHREADRGEIENGVLTHPGFGAKPRDDQVGRRADQGDHAAENGRERQRHQHPARRQVLFRRHLQGDGHQQGKRANIVHEAREHGRQGHDGEKVQGRPRRGGQHPFCQHVHRAADL